MLRKVKLLSVVVGLLLSLSVGQAGAVLTVVDPDAFADGTDISNAFAGVTLSTVGGGDGTTGVVLSVTPSSAFFTASGSEAFNASTGTLSFGHDGLLNGLPSGNIWIEIDDISLRADFATMVTDISIDVIGNNGSDIGQLQAYSAADVLLDTVSTSSLMLNQVETLLISRAQGDIAYILAYGLSTDTVGLDNLQFAAAVPAPGALLLGGLGVSLVGWLRRRRAL